ncbi:hypothetical protein V5E97_27005 [Singulisphaera sp. Ch08]|uniref:Uncharacterized protein n=1 Tax=Singulisphaera sp. Ch08 TaxID=3120278 RepID=A0AAU7CA21_9BACT
MSESRHPTRRDVLTAAAGAVGGQLVGGRPPSLLAATTPDQAKRPETDSSGSFLLESPRMPEPTVVLPTDALPPPQGQPKRLAAITTAYFKYSHADDIITKFIEGYAIAGRTHQPHCQVVSLAIEQFPPSDIGRGMAARYGIPLFETPAEALGLGGDSLDVDGVILIGEHGDYPTNAKGQHLYPRRRLFEEIVKVFRRSGRSVPVYNDKHFSYSWENARWMYEQSRTLGFPMMAGSSVPVAWRRPALAFRQGITLDSGLAFGFAGLEVYGFHTLELLQSFVERRGQGAIGVKAVQCLQGEAAWDAAREGRWPADLVHEAIRHLPKHKAIGTDPEALSKADPNAVVLLVEYRDGFQAAAYLSRGLADEFAFAARVRGTAEPVGTWSILNKPQRDHFSFLCNHIEVMFRTGQPSYPVERTYLVTGILAALIDSQAAGGTRLETPHLTDLSYTPAPELTDPS